MAKLEIRLNDRAKEKKRSEHHIYTFNDYDILIDGHEPSMLTSFELDMSCMEFPQASITFNVDELEVEADALVAIKAQQKQK